MNSLQDDSRREIVRLVEADHENTIELIARLVTLRGALQGIAATAGASAAGFAVGNSSWVIALVAVPFVLLIAAVDARTSFLVRGAHHRAVDLETKIDAYISSIREVGRPMSSTASDQLDERLDSYLFGMSRSLRSGKMKKIWAAASRSGTFWISPVVALLLTITTLVVALSPSTADSLETCLLSDQGGTVPVDELPQLATGRVTLIGCPQ